MRILLTVFISIIYAIGYAHNAQEASFNIETTSNTIEIYAEFPWTIRKALLTAHPELDKSSNQSDYDRAFFNYVKSNLILTNENQDTLKLLSINKADSLGSSHHVNYNFTYQKLAYTTISNTLLFNVNSQQINIHNFKIKEQKFLYKTKVSSPSFEITHKKEPENAWTILVTCIGIALVVLLFKQAFTKPKPTENE